MFQRPMILILFSFGIGISFGHIARAHHQLLLFCLLLTLLLLIISLFITLPLRFLCFISVFFMLGILLDLTSHHESDLLPLASNRERVIMEGILLQPVRIIKEMSRLEVKSRNIICRNKARPIRERVLVTVFRYPRHFSPGEVIRFPARLRPFKNFNNPGGYNYELAMSLRGFSCAASVSDGRYIVLLGKEDLGFSFQMLERIRKPLRKFFRESLSHEEHALTRALILGERQEISPELRETFNRAGLGHILAVSGLHIGLVAWLVFFLSKWLLSLSYRLMLKTDIHRMAALITCLPVVA